MRRAPRTYLDVPLAALQQRDRLLNTLVGDGGKLLECQLLVLGQLADVDVGLGHGAGEGRLGPRGAAAARPRMRRRARVLRRLRESAVDKVAA